MPYWIDAQTWICDKHIPSVHIPGTCPACWLGCGSLRPEDTEPRLKKPLPPPPPRPARAPRLDSPLSSHQSVPKKTPPKTKPKPAPRPEVLKEVVAKAVLRKAPLADGEGPTQAEIRRGATMGVACSKCAKTLWRRKKDLGRVFSCADREECAARAQILIQKALSDV